MRKQTVLIVAAGLLLAVAAGAGAVALSAATAPDDPPPRAAESPLPEDPDELADLVGALIDRFRSLFGAEIRTAPEPEPGDAAHRSSLEEIARVLGIDPRQLLAEWSAGRSLEEIADDAGVDLDEVGEAVAGVLEGRVHAALERGEIAEDEAEALHDFIDDNLAAILRLPLGVLFDGTLSFGAAPFGPDLLFRFRPFEGLPPFDQYGGDLPEELRRLLDQFDGFHGDGPGQTDERLRELMRWLRERLPDRGFHPPGSPDPPHDCAFGFIEPFDGGLFRFGAASSTTRSPDLSASTAIVSSSRRR